MVPGDSESQHIPGLELVHLPEGQMLMQLLHDLLLVTGLEMGNVNLAAVA